MELVKRTATTHTFLIIYHSTQPHSMMILLYLNYPKVFPILIQICEANIQSNFIVQALMFIKKEKKVEGGTSSTLKSTFFYQVGGSAKHYPKRASFNSSLSLSLFALLNSARFLFVVWSDELEEEKEAEPEEEKESSEAAPDPQMQQQQRQVAVVVVEWWQQRQFLSSVVVAATAANCCCRDRQIRDSSGFGWDSSYTFPDLFVARVERSFERVPVPSFFVAKFECA
jgi:hypothetical protein